MDISVDKRKQHATLASNNNNSNNNTNNNNNNNNYKTKNNNEWKKNKRTTKTKRRLVKVERTCSFHRRPRRLTCRFYVRAGQRSSILPWISQLINERQRATLASNNNNNNNNNSNINNKIA
jgi:hypothetical protein